MTEEVTKHLYSIAITLVLKYGIKYKFHYEEMADYWDGPLNDNLYFVNRRKVIDLKWKKLKPIMTRMHGVKFHPVYTRDFFQGVIDASCCCENRNCLPRFKFAYKEKLANFFKSDIHGFKIEFENVKYGFRTRPVSFLCLPCDGDLDLYFAGALTASVPIMKDNQLLFRVKKKCADNFKRLYISYLEDDKFLYLSPFYILLFSGEIPEDFYLDFLKRINSCKVVQLRQGCMDALFHWRLINKLEQWKHGEYPLLQSPVVYHRFLGLKKKLFDQQMKERRKDFVDERIASRCLRWYSTHKALTQTSLQNTPNIRENKNERIQIHSL